MGAELRPRTQWTRAQVQHVNASTHRNRQLSPAILELKSLIEDNPRINMLFTQMLDDQVPHQQAFATDPLNRTEIRNYHELLWALNQIISEGLQWSSVANDLGLLAAPMVVILDYPMQTPAGYAAFLEPEVNRVMQNILNEWGIFLTSPQSAQVLNTEDGWFSPEGLEALEATANAPLKTQYKFEEFFQTRDSNATDFGFRSWDDFFTRRLRAGVRPLSSPDDDNVIANPCEAKPYNMATKVPLHSKFWIKNQEYSIQDMLGNDELAPIFANGTLYQAYLSALSYHRWHAPVSGTVVKAFVQEGTYFSEPLQEPLSTNESFFYDIQPRSLNNLNTQGYLAALNTRGIIFIEADNPVIGLMAFIAVGNYEVSTIELAVEEGQYIEKGQETGMFHFGGSSFVILFQEGVEIEGFPSVEGTPDNVALLSQLAVVKP
nr:phosphatidylserine decarboxylase proenzyme 3 [Quercus suber]